MSELKFRSCVLLIMILLLITWNSFQSRDVGRLETRIETLENPIRKYVYSQEQFDRQVPNEENIRLAPDSIKSSDTTNRYIFKVIYPDSTVICTIKIPTGEIKSIDGEQQGGER